MISFWNVSLSRGKPTTRFAGSTFLRRTVTIFIGRETKTHILQTKLNEKIEVSLSNNNYSLTIKKPFNNNTTTQQQKQQQHQQQQQQHPITTGEARSRPGVTVAGGPACTEDTAVNNYICLGRRAVLPLERHIMDSAFSLGQWTRWYGWVHQH